VSARSSRDSAPSLFGSLSTRLVVDADNLSRAGTSLADTLGSVANNSGSHTRKVAGTRITNELMSKIPCEKSHHARSISRLRKGMTVSSTSTKRKPGQKIRISGLAEGQISLEATRDGTTTSTNQDTRSNTIITIMMTATLTIQSIVEATSITTKGKTMTEIRATGQLTSGTMNNGVTIILAKLSTTTQEAEVKPSSQSLTLASMDANPIEERQRASSVKTLIGNSSGRKTSSTSVNFVSRSHTTRRTTSSWNKLASVANKLSLSVQSTRIVLLQPNLKTSSTPRKCPNQSTRMTT
jgi:hypothetical protein